MNKAIWTTIIILLVVASLFIIYILKFSSNEISALPTNQNNLSLNVEKCITNLTSYYQQRSTSVSQETGLVLVGIGFINNGVNEANRDDVINAIESYGIQLSNNKYGVWTQGAQMFTFIVPLGEEIKWTCIFLDDERIKPKTEWIIPDFVSNRPRVPD